MVDTFEGLRTLAGRARERSAAHIVAITGSVGKTGTKELLAAALASAGPTLASAGNLNNHIGAPLSLARLPQGAAYGVFEVGMNHPGEIAPLSCLIRPHTALITTIAAAHTEYFTGLDAVADAKAEIFQGLEPGGTAVLNRDNAHFGRLGRRRARRRRRPHRVFPAKALRRTRASSHGTLPPPAAPSPPPSTASGSTTRIAFSGRHWALNSVAVLA